MEHARLYSGKTTFSVQQEQNRKLLESWSMTPIKLSIMQAR